MTVFKRAFRDTISRELLELGRLRSRQLFSFALVVHPLLGQKREWGVRAAATCSSKLNGRP